MMPYAADAPNAADWLEAWATLAGAVLSGIAVLVAVLVLRHELRARREDKRDVETAQARLVKGYVSPWRESPEDKLVAGFYGVHNRSSKRITDVKVSIYRPDAAALLGYRLAFSSNEDENFVDVVDADSRSEIKLSPGRAPWANALFPRVVVTFTDGAGLRWERTDSEEPMRLPEGLSAGDVKIRFGILSLFSQYAYLPQVAGWIRVVKYRLTQQLFLFLSTRLHKRDEKRRRAASESPKDVFRIDRVNPDDVQRFVESLDDKKPGAAASD